MAFFQFTSFPQNITINVAGTTATYNFIVYFYAGTDYLFSTDWTQIAEQVTVPNGATCYRVLLRHSDNSNISPSEMSSITATINYAEEISVNSWSGFVTALNVSGAVVVLPENAVWDMNEILPYGFTENINIACKAVYGNGTRIKNLRLFGMFIATSKCFFNNILITDIIASGSAVNSDLFRGDIFFRNSSVSCILSSSYRDFLKRNTNYDDDVADNSSFYVEASAANFQFKSGPGSSDYSKYCRFEIHAPNATDQVLSGTMQTCEIVIFAPNSTKIYSSDFIGCTLRGNLASVSEQEWSGSWEGDISVYSTDGFNPSYSPKYPQYFIGVTEEQLKNPEYLRSLGFPIVVG